MHLYWMYKKYLIALIQRLLRKKVLKRKKVPCKLISKELVIAKILRILPNNLYHISNNIENLREKVRYNRKKKLVILNLKLKI